MAFFFLTIFYGNLKAELLPVKTYTTSDGLPRDLVTQIKQDSRGFLWFCTSEGISKFDGERIKNFTVADGLPSRFVYDFLESADGKIYIATGKGLARLNPHGIRGSGENPLFEVFVPANTKAESIRKIYQNKAGEIWIGTSDGLFRFDENKNYFEVVSADFFPSENIVINDIIEGGNDLLWVATSKHGLLVIDSGKLKKQWSTEENLPENHVTSLLRDQNGQIWAGFRPHGGLCIFSGENLKRCYSQNDGLSAEWIRDFLLTKDGNIWLATISGLCHWQGENAGAVCKNYDEKNDLCREIDTLAEDKDGNIWTGSACGLKKIAHSGFTTYDEKDGLDYPKANSIFENPAGELFISTNFIKRAVSRFEGDKFSLARPRFPKNLKRNGWGWQQTVWQDRQGIWWIPTGAGLYRTAERTSFDKLSENALEKAGEGIVEGEIFRLFEDSQSNLWVSITDNRLIRFIRTENRWEDLTERIGLEENRLISAFEEDRHGNIWIGTGSDHAEGYNNGVLVRYRNGKFDLFTKNEHSPRGWIRDLFIDSRGWLWIASTEDGLQKIENTNTETPDFVRYGIEQGLTSNSTACVTEDAFGRIYVGSWRGIDRLTTATEQFENFSDADGLPSGFVESAYRDRTNRLWFITEKGVASFQPEPSRKRQSPTILLTALGVNGEPQNISILGENSIPTLYLNSDQRQITLDFIGLGSSLGEKLRYEYRFKNSDWTATDERSLNFANLAAGEYVFEVRTQTADGIYSQNPATVSFQIAAPVWQRWWFIAVVLVLVFLTVYLIYRNRLKRLLEMERVRMRIATDLHDDIGSNLTKISIMSEVAQRIQGKKQSEILHSIADISRASVSSMSDIVWAINPKKDSLLELVRRMRSFAEDILEQKGIGLQFDAPEESEEIKLDADMRRDVYLVFKESLNNIIKHSDATAVRIDIRVLKGKLRLTVSDNGKGFKTDNGSMGNGLFNMKKRAEILSGKCSIDSNASDGTRVVLEVPLER